MEKQSLRDTTESGRLGIPFHLPGRIARTVLIGITVSLAAIGICLSGCESDASLAIPKGQTFDVGGLANVDVATLQRGIGVGDLALETYGRDSAGKKFALDDYQGQVVVMEFWADW